jgi:hypothetical protein
MPVSAYVLDVASGYAVLAAQIAAIDPNSGETVP